MARLPPKSSASLLKWASAGLRFSPIYQPGLDTEAEDVLTARAYFTTCQTLPAFSPFTSPCIASSA